MFININENVRVKLTNYGREVLQRDHHTFWKRVHNDGGQYFEYRPPVEDADGWSTWQMWCLMKDLGKYQGLCTKNVFELDIEIMEVDK